MAIVRIARRRKFVQAERAAVEDQRLSLRAVGLLVWLLAKPDDWTIDSSAISRATKEGRDAIRTAMRELEDAGYLVRDRHRDAPTGQWRTETFVHECPVAPETDSQALDSQAPENQAPDSQAVRTNTEHQLRREPPNPPTASTQATARLRSADDLAPRAIPLAERHANRQRAREINARRRAVSSPAAQTVPDPQEVLTCPAST